MSGPTRTPGRAACASWTRPPVERRATAPAPARAAERGVSTIELLMATAVLMAIVSALFAVTHPSRGAFAPVLHAVDQQQRLRASAEALTRDLLMAGSGPIAGPAAGPLIGSLAPVMPHRIGARGGEAGVFRADAIGVLSLPPSAAQGTLRVSDGSARIGRFDRRLSLEPSPHCGAGRPACGFAPGMRAMLFDRSGAWDLVRVTRVDPDAVEIADVGGLSTAYPAGATLAEVSARTFYLHTAAAAGIFQLRRYDGFDSDLPLVDDVVAMEVEYLGDPEPPRVLAAGGAAPPDRLRTTYGPPPPAIGDDNPNDTWGIGESCLFSVAGGTHIPRLPPLAAGGALVALSPPALTDGPWCPDDVSPHRVDADLFRVRLVRIVLRVQVTPAVLRGPAGLLFTHGGSARSSARVVPDLEVRLDVAPRSM